MHWTLRVAKAALFAALIGAGLANLPLVAGYAAEAAAKTKYVGAEQNCRMCHSDIYAGWQKTAHARAFAALENVGKSKDSSCLQCHTTGYGQGGYVDENSTSNLKGVQCEACHGPGGDHNGDKSKINGSPAAKVCAKCHFELGIHGS